MADEALYALTIEELTVIANAILHDLKEDTDSPDEWHFINKPIAKEVLRKIKLASEIRNLPKPVTPRGY